MLSTSIKSKMPASTLSLFNLIKVIIDAYFRIFPKIWPLVLLSSVVHLIVPFLAIYNVWFAALAFLGFVLITWYLYIAILCLSDVALKGGNMNFSSAFNIAKRRYIGVLSSNLIFFGIGTFVFLLEYTIGSLLQLIDQTNVYVVLTVVIDVVVFVSLYFSIPLIALDNLPVLKAFEQSARMVRHHWWRIFIVLAFVGLLIMGFEALGILFTGKVRLFLFTGYHFFVQIIFYPLIISATLILLNDLKLYYQRSQ